MAATAIVTAGNYAARSAAQIKVVCVCVCVAASPGVKWLPYLRVVSNCGVEVEECCVCDLVWFGLR